MSDQALAPLNAAVAARAAGRVPTAAQLAFATKNRWSHGYDLSTWNSFGGSQNIEVYAAAALADWPFHAALARHWRAEGLFGTELGCDNRYYSSGVIEATLIGYRTQALLAVDAEDIRLAVRAYLAWLALAAIPVTRVRDELVTGAGTVIGTRPVAVRGKQAPMLTGLAVAPAGNRYHTGRGGAKTLTSDDAGSELLAAALGHSSAYAITEDEENLLHEVVFDGKAEAAREVSAWLFGTLAGWCWTLRRTTEGAETVFWAGSRGPNTNKPARAVGQVRLDGSYSGLQPAPRGSKGWAEGWVVTLEDGVYTASCASGTASLPALGGEELWRAEIDGPEVRFS